MMYAGARGTLLGSAAIVVTATAAILAVPAIRRTRDGDELGSDSRAPFAVEISR